MGSEMCIRDSISETQHKITTARYFNTPSTHTPNGPTITPSRAQEEQIKPFPRQPCSYPMSEYASSRLRVVDESVVPTPLGLGGPIPCVTGGTLCDTPIRDTPIATHRLSETSIGYEKVVYAEQPRITTTTFVCTKFYRYAILHMQCTYNYRTLLCFKTPQR